MSLQRWELAARRAGTHTLLVFPPALLAGMLSLYVHRHAVAYDFVNAYLPAARAVLHGIAPYHPSATALASRTVFVYPPVAAYLYAPFTLLPLGVAEALATVLTGAVVVAIPWLLGVRDWRCYAAAFLWAPVYVGLQNVNLSVPLALAAAVVWLLRRRRYAPGVLVGLMVAVKLFAWPLLVFLLVTKRVRAAAAAVGVAGAAILVPWAALAFGGLTRYPHLLQTVEHRERLDTYTLGAVLAPLVSWTGAAVIGYAAGAVLLVACYRARADDRTAYLAALAATLVASPIVWLHYFVLLLVALGIAVPRLSVAWLLPIALWPCASLTDRAVWQTALALVIVAAVFVLAARGNAGAVDDERPSAGRPVDVPVAADGREAAIAVAAR
jgi:Glycosyltransferase family 87